MSLLHVNNGELGGIDIDRDKYPRLCALILSGAASIDGHTIVGHASDGVEVDLGTTNEAIYLGNVESYLSAHPTPDTW